MAVCLGDVSLTKGISYMKKLALAVAVTLLTTASAQALDLTQPPLKTIDGKDFVDNTGKTLDFTADAVIENSLLAVQAGSETEKADNWRLAQKVYSNRNNITFTPEEVLRIKKAAAATQPTAVFGSLMTFIDPTFSKN